jgi:hypothetical protein
VACGGVTSVAALVAVRSVATCRVRARRVALMSRSSSWIEVRPLLLLLIKKIRKLSCITFF